MAIPTAFDLMGKHDPDGKREKAQKKLREEMAEFLNENGVSLVAGHTSVYRVVPPVTRGIHDSVPPATFFQLAYLLADELETMGYIVEMIESGTFGGARQVQMVIRIGSRND
jgi:hypothetical protein